MPPRKEGNVLRTILILRKKTSCLHIGYSFRLTARIVHTTAFVTPVVEHCLEREIAQWVHQMKDRTDDPSLHERTLLPRSYISLPCLSDIVFCLVPITTLLSLSGVHCHPRSAPHGGVLSNWETGGRHTGPGLVNSVCVRVCVCDNISIHSLKAAFANSVLLEINRGVTEAYNI